MPKREHFLLAFFTLSKPIWVCDLGTGKKNLSVDPFWFLLFGANWVGGKQKQFEARPKLKVVGGCFWGHMYDYNVFFEKY
jgi:hypothetical protein